MFSHILLYHVVCVYFFIIIFLYQFYFHHFPPCLTHTCAYTNTQPHTAEDIKQKEVKLKLNIEPIINQTQGINKKLDARNRDTARHKKRRKGKNKQEMRNSTQGKRRNYIQGSKDETRHKAAKKKPDR